ncbi:MAG: hypothetical protein HND50_12435 [Calditrichaeota bacterium]|nr:hypothetical protein [Calditrichota bacterium]
MESLGIIGFVFGMSGLSFALISYQRISKLENKLKEIGVLDKDFSTGETL